MFGVGQVFFNATENLNEQIAKEMNSNHLLKNQNPVLLSGWKESNTDQCS